MLVAERVSVVCEVAEGLQVVALTKGCAEGGCGRSSGGCWSANACISVVVRTGGAKDGRIAEAGLSRAAAVVVLEEVVPGLVGALRRGEVSAVDSLFAGLRWGMYSQDGGCACEWPSSHKVCGGCVGLWKARRERFKVGRCVAPGLVEGAY